MGDHQLKKVEDFIYLESFMQANEGSEKEVAKRIQAEWGAWHKITGIICDRKVPAAVKGKMYKNIVPASNVVQCGDGGSN